MSDRQISKSKREWLVRQLDSWQLHGMMTKDQASSVLGLYATQTELADRIRKKAMITLMGVAALLIGLGALLLVGFNWETMPSALKLFLLFSALIGAHAIGLFLRFKRDSKLLSEAVFFLACFLYGIGIFLVAQVFHVNAHYPDGVWWWALGVLPFALYADTLLLHILLVSLLAIWCEMEIVHFSNFGMWFFGRWASVPNVAYSLPLLVIPGLIWAYQKKSVTAVALYVLLFSWWILLQPFGWHSGVDGLYFVGLVGGAMLVVSESHESGSRYAIPFRFFGVLLSLGGLLVISTFQLNKHIYRVEPSFTNLVMSLSIVVLTATVIVVAAIMKRRQLRTAVSFVEFVQQNARRQYLPIGLVGVFALLLSGQWLAIDPLISTIVANIAVLLLAGWIAALGIREDRGFTFVAGVLCVLLWAVIRYVDLFGDVGGILGAAMMFFVCGAALFGVAIFWSKRKTKTDRLDTNEH